MRTKETKYSIAYFQNSKFSVFGVMDAQEVSEFIDAHGLEDGMYAVFAGTEKTLKTTVTIEDAEPAPKKTRNKPGPKPGSKRAAKKTEQVVAPVPPNGEHKDEARP